MSLAGTVKGIFPYVDKVELSPIEMNEETDQCKRRLTIHSMGCTLELVLFGPTPETLTFPAEERV